MSSPLEHYALSDLRTGPLVSRDRSMGRLCLPRFGDEVKRRYLATTFILETIRRSPTGAARITDFLPPSGDRAALIRRVECTEGTVRVEHDLRVRFDYARATPWFRRVHDTAAGPRT